MWRRRLGAGVVALAAVALAGCRACSAEDAALGEAGPPMPSGMLVPLSSASAEAPAPPLRMARHVRGPSGTWVELQHVKPGADPREIPAVHWQDDSAFVPVTALTGPLHECFARALPGFTLFVAQRFDPNALGRLATELEVYARAAPPDDALGAIAKDVAAFSRDAAENGIALWVSAP